MLRSCSTPSTVGFAAPSWVCTTRMKFSTSSVWLPAKPESLFHFVGVVASQAFLLSFPYVAVNYMVSVRETFNDSKRSFIRVRCKVTCLERWTKNEFMDHVRDIHVQSNLDRREGEKHA
jgi:hypothetical protein